MGEVVGEVPAWFSAALATVPEHRDVKVDGCRIHLRCWGDEQLPGLVFVHGGAAHSGWWDHVAPFFASSHRVVALDLSGHGDSEWRQHYDMSLWVSEVFAAAEAGGIRGRAIVVGHSMGGWVATTAGVEYADRLAGVVVLDSPFNDQPPEEARLRQRRRATRVYRTREEAVDRFTTLPAQEVLLPYVREHIATQSLREVDGGWTWKFDPTMFGPRQPMSELLPELRAGDPRDGHADGAAARPPRRGRRTARHRAPSHARSALAARGCAANVAGPMVEVRGALSRPPGGCALSSIPTRGR
jgi:pimeloyl-ACP methyl ester carboxylesterase